MGPDTRFAQGDAISVQMGSGATVIAVTGELDRAAGHALEAAFGSATTGAQAVVLDLVACTSYATAGLEAFLRAWQRTTIRALPFAIACLPERVPSLLADLASRGVFALYPTRARALAALSASCASR